MRYRGRRSFHEQHESVPNPSHFPLISRCSHDPLTLPRQLPIWTEGCRSWYKDPGAFRVESPHCGRSQVSTIWKCSSLLARKRYPSLLELRCICASLGRAACQIPLSGLPAFES